MNISSSGGSLAAAMTQQMRERMFTRADADRSRDLSLDEVRAANAAREGWTPGAGPAPDPAGKTPWTAGHTAITARDAARTAFRSLDAGKDGEVSQGELERKLTIEARGRLGREAVDALIEMQAGLGGSKSDTATLIRETRSRLFDRADGDASSGLSFREFTDLGLKRRLPQDPGATPDQPRPTVEGLFRRGDQDGDGALGVPELQAALARGQRRLDRDKAPPTLLDRPEVRLALAQTTGQLVSDYVAYRKAGGGTDRTA